MTTIEVRASELHAGDVWVSPTGRLWLLSEVARWARGVVSARGVELGRPGTEGPATCAPEWQASDFVEVLLAERPG